MATSEKKKSSRKERSGRVVSDSMDKTIVVVAESKRPDPMYGKMVRHSKRLHVHDEKNEAKIGDQVRVVETRPLSKKKRWRLVKIEVRSEQGI